MAAGSLTLISCLLSSLEEHFRDACQQGDLDAVKRVLAGFDHREANLLLHSQSSCTGTPLFDAIISHVRCFPQVFVACFDPKTAFLEICRHIHVVFQQPQVVEHLLDLNVIDLELECEVDIFYPIFFRDKCEFGCKSWLSFVEKFSNCQLKEMQKQGKLNEDRTCHAFIALPFFAPSGSALCVACACGDVSITTMLLEHGSDVNRTSQHSSPLIYASEYDNVELVTVLLNYGARIKEVNRRLRVCWVHVTV